MKPKKYKDQCDCCKKFDYLKGCSNGMCLCEKCINKFQLPKRQHQMTIFDSIVRK